MFKKLKIKWHKIQIVKYKKKQLERKKFFGGLTETLCPDWRLYQTKIFYHEEKIRKIKNV